MPDNLDINMYEKHSGLKGVYNLTGKTDTKLLSKMLVL